MSSAIAAPTPAPHAAPLATAATATAASSTATDDVPPAAGVAPPASAAPLAAAESATAWGMGTSAQSAGQPPAHSPTGLRMPHYTSHGAPSAVHAAAALSHSTTPASRKRTREMAPLLPLPLPPAARVKHEAGQGEDTSIAVGMGAATGVGAGTGMPNLPQLVSFLPAAGLLSPALHAAMSQPQGAPTGGTLPTTTTTSTAATTSTVGTGMAAPTLPRYAALPRAAASATAAAAAVAAAAANPFLLAPQWNHKQLLATFRAAGTAPMPAATRATSMPSPTPPAAHAPQTGACGVCAACGARVAWAALRWHAPTGSAVCVPCATTSFAAAHAAHAHALQHFQAAAAAAAAVQHAQHLQQQQQQGVVVPQHGGQQHGGAGKRVARKKAPPARGGKHARGRSSAPRVCARCKSDIPRGRHWSRDDKGDLLCRLCHDHKRLQFHKARRDLVCSWCGTRESKGLWKGLTSNQPLCQQCYDRRRYLNSKNK